MPRPGHHHRGVDPRSTAPGARFTRRRALGLSGLLGATGLLAACGSQTAPQADATAPAPSGAATGGIDEQLTAMLASAPRCVMTTEETQGPYWFDVDAIRSDIREDRTGMPMELALRVQDLAQCTADPSTGGVQNAVVEIWHCDAMGVYSGFRNGFGAPGSGAPPGPPPGGEGAGPGPSGAPPGPPAFDSSGAPSSGETSDGSYSAGDVESTPSGTATFLRGAQVTDADGVVRFTSIFPGWYSGRAVHVHIKVHVDKKTVLTTQLYFDDGLTDAVYKDTAPYDRRGKRDTRNGSDAIYDPTGLSVSRRSDGTVLTALNLGIDT
ncbi:protocatechuate dioxygenase [Tomitella gaofuii]|uniref:protocatechuate dioxygenase n=1 Tax=Tomitella gaofuii TaxID=2760083 RepID=UPI0015FDB9AE|nr:protocatechuate dioxygenase [Tomitella gaofuii]